MRLGTSITHQNEKFNKKLQLLGNIFLGVYEEDEVILFEDEENIIYFRNAIFFSAKNENPFKIEPIVTLVRKYETR